MALDTGWDTSRRDFDAFYQAHFDTVVRIAFGLTADRHEAHDVAQEAFCRAWQHWSALDQVDNRLAWVRRVTANLAASRWRRLKTARANLWRYLPGSEAAPSPDHVVLVQALRALPQQQRHAILLHYYVDLSTEETARELGVPTGTVKSWLHRGRAELAMKLADQAPDGRRAPVSQIMAKGDRRRLSRVAAVVAACATAVVLAIAGSQLIQRDPPVPPADPSPRPSISPELLGQVPADDPMRRVDWASATITMAPNSGWGCPSGTHTFARATGKFEGFVVSGPSTGSARIAYSPARVALGDLTGDGRAEAAIEMHCDVPQPKTPAQMLVVRLDELNQLRTVGWFNHPSTGVFDSWVDSPWWSPPESKASNYWITDGLLYLEGPSMRGHHGKANAYRWDGQRMVETAEAPRFTPKRLKFDTDQIDMSPLWDRFDCQVPAPEARWMFSSESEVAYPTLGRHGLPYLVGSVECFPKGGRATKNRQLVTFDFVDGRWLAVAAIPAPARLTLGFYRVTGAEVTINWYLEGTFLPPSETTHRWTGSAWE